ncbi:leucine-rich repeat protein [Paenibacillus sp. PAMC21692]|uniref:leucine-rich repeat protein n=1 Tax=Paenibacillus sp. PAMC21692 TaxID=2762320 RepID=UPI00164D9624|nr:leucine-rich repeat protein [Paenibacillus sp. PAMC21692]QNK56916.1 leucine-rich repeat protein [Paenibacillus sp. PAMC21692]
MNQKVLGKSMLVILAVLLVWSGNTLYPVPMAQAAESDYEFLLTVDGTAVRISNYLGDEAIVDIPAQFNGLNVVEISTGAFRGKQLTAVNIPNTVKNIGEEAFAGNSLTELIIPNSVTEIGRKAFENNLLASVELPDSLTTIRQSAFQYNLLSSLVIPNSVTEIEWSVFSDNILETVEISDRITTINPLTFANNRLTTLNIPSSVSTIGVESFKNNLLPSLIIPDTVTAINPGAFSENKLTYVKIPDSITTISGGVFRNNLLTTVNIPDSITEIGEIAFMDNQLTSLTIPSSVTQIGGRAFMSNQLTELTLPSSVISVGRAAFGDNEIVHLLALNPNTTFGNYLFDLVSPAGQVISENPLEVTFYSEDPSNAKTYAANNGYLFQDLNAELKNLELDIPGLHFNPIERNFNLATNADSVTVTATSAVPFSEVKINQTVVPYGSSTAPIDLVEGSKTITIDVEAPNALTEQYQIELEVDHTTPVIDLTPIPTSPTNGDVTVMVDVEEEGSGVNSLKWAQGMQTTGYFASGGTAFTEEFAVSENGDYTVYASDHAGNEAVETITIANIDRQAPVIGLTPNPTSPTNGDVTVTVDVADAGGEISSLKWAQGTQTTGYFASGGTAFTDEFTVSENGDYTVYARDRTGNESVETITIANIDRLRPVIGLTPNPTSPTNGDVTVTVDAADAGSGIDSLKWAQGTQTAGYFASGGTPLTDEFTVSENGAYTVYASDRAGNETVQSITIANIDRLAPVIELTPMPTSPTYGNVTVTVAVVETGSGIDSLMWAQGTQTAGYFASGGTAFTGGFTVSENGVYTVYARDHAGNEAVQSITIENIDRLAPEIGLTPSPTSPTNGDVTVSVAVTEAGSGTDSLKWAEGTQTAEYFANEGEALLTDEFTVSENGDYTVYASDRAGNEAVQSITIANIDRLAPVIELTPMPTGPTYGNVTVTVDVGEAGSGINSLKWAEGTQTAEYFASEGVTFTDEFTVSKNGDYTVYARDHAGNEAVQSITIANILVVPPTQPWEGPKTEVKLKDGVIVIKVAPRDIVNIKQDDGEVVDVVKLPDVVLEQIPKLLEKVDKPIVRIEINERKSPVQLPLPAKILKEAQAVRPDVVFETRLDSSSFQLEVNVLDLDGLAAKLGTDINDLHVNILIKVVTGSRLEGLVQAAEKEGMQLLSEPIEFQLVVTGGGQTLELNDFGGAYMIKSIILDTSLAQKNYTAVLYDPADQSFTFVPAVSSLLLDGRSEKVMRMPHNSIYAIMEADQVRFADMTSHWARLGVEHLASKRVVTGMSKTSYAPDRAVTRAEFTALLVRALGLRVQSVADGNLFADVQSSDWYASAVEAGARSGLVRGIGESSFAPNEQVTREQIAVMLANAYRIATEATVSAGSTADVLSRFEDAAKVSSWAQDAMAESVASGFIQGKTANQLAPTETATRAQAAVMLERFMKEIGFLE